MLKSLVLCAVFVFAGSLVQAQPKAPTTPVANAPMATVNGIAIPTSLLEQNVRANVAQGQRDSPELRQTLMVELLLTDMMKKNPITDVNIKAEYDRRVEVLKNEQQYKVGLIVTSTEDETKAILVRLNKGESFQKIAEQSSIDPSKAKGGDVGWVLPAQILPAISNVLVNLKKDTAAVAPIRTQAGWNIIKLEDQRIYQPPGLNEAKNDIRQDLAQKQRVEFVKRLREDAKVQ